MAVPKQKHTKSRRNKRRAHIFLKAAILAKCPKCRKPILPHTVCQNCGYYKGAEVFDVLKNLTKRDRKKRAKEMEAKEKEEKEKTKEKPLTWEKMSRG